MNDKCTLELHQDEGKVVIASGDFISVINPSDDSDYRKLEVYAQIDPMSVIMAYKMVKRIAKDMCEAASPNEQKMLSETCKTIFDESWEEMLYE